ncbi:c-type cytochrome [Oleiagrimonas soli]|uniref:Mono/diheme cytochrome c family protein n=1 Tax=Oleiagrimonas soli TaxID=1543381 RepID=A0A841KP88_9GAMM|nr:cytochrome c [Oleiagrimonas soli]MBB6183774.1 mono/diheme cytochrome c family protein [Oleiagrimonas soli]
MKWIGSLILVVVLGAVALGAWVYSGLYDIGADAPHWTVTRKAIAVLRERSIDTRAAKITDIPDLDDPALIRLGAAHYREMCTGCHLAPGMHDSELRTGLYPQPPDLTRFAPEPAEAFWVIKHGVKMTAMPAWGKTHDDHKIWAMVAYLEKQPGLSAAQYQALTAGAADDDDDAPHDHASSEPAAASSASRSASAPAPASSAP